ncbi:MAG: hypothetical protein M1837_007198 [Sclerophora amabilis]|nr:MAG: hypothetical protein M1837_007198 [Sclerophora amabilis]
MARTLHPSRFCSSLPTLRHRPPRWIDNVRGFSSVPSLYARAQAELPTSRNPSQQSVSGAIRNVNAVDLPEDFGLLDDTFIMPTGSRLPSVWRDPVERALLEFDRMRYHVYNFVSLLIYRFSPPRGQRPSLGLRQTAPTAAVLHKRLYTAFADYDPPFFRPVVTNALYHAFRSRLFYRPRGQTCRWTLHNYTRRVKCVSDRAARLPVQGAAIRQAVVRIWAKQSLERWDEKGKLVPGSDQVKEIKEWVVLQRRVVGGKESPWVIWGMIGEEQIGEEGHVWGR